MTKIGIFNKDNSYGQFTEAGGFSQYLYKGYSEPGAATDISVLR